MVYVIKVKYENSLRRFTWENEVGNDELSFSRLESRIREIFSLSSATEVKVTYTDKDGDVVTMANDHDLKDALVHQSINPLRLHVTLVESNLTGSVVDTSVVELLEKSKMAIEADHERVDAQLVNVLRNVAFSADIQALTQLLQSAEPLLQKVKSPAQIRHLMESFVQTVISRPQQSAPVESNPSGLPGAADKSLDAVSLEKSVAESPAVAAPVGGAQAAVENDGAGVTEKSRVVHHGVLCDVCGISPIVGLRWKSIKKQDYDLCASCFEKHGNVNEYAKIDQQMFRPRHFLNRRYAPSYPPMGQTISTHMGSVCHGSGSLGCRYSGMRGMSMNGMSRRPSARTVQNPTTTIYGGKLDARFVRDVTIFDGTELAPGTKFTKIWRLRNSGAGTWPSNTVLVHVGGDELGQASMMPLDLPVEGFAPEREIEAAVDFTAPEKPGRYFSYWRLQASAHGPKFGHRVWVLIQVKEVLDDQVAGALSSADDSSTQEVKAVTDSLSPSDSDSIKSAARVDVLEAEAIASDAPAQEVISVANNVSASEVSTESFDLDLCEVEAAAGQLQTTSSFENVENSPVDNVDVKSEVNGVEGVVEQVVNKVGQADESSTLGDGFSMVDRHSESASRKELSLQLEVGTNVESVEEHLFEFGEEEKIEEGTVDEGSQVINQVPDTPVRNTEAPAAEEDLSSPDGLLAKLSTMGFTEVKLNLELLEKNNMDLRKTLDELCAAEEWDPILEELEEMGFYDTDMNRRLMFKNNGSVKRVVKDLVQMDRETSGKGKKVVE